MNNTFKNTKILIVGGAGFVGSNLTKMLLNDHEPKTIVVVDNLISSEKTNLPLNDPRLIFIEGSITKDSILNQIDDTFQYVFHLATYHGNQSSIHDPIADHENNTFTTLRLFNHFKNFKNLNKLVYSSAGCSVADKTFDSPEATTEEAPINLIQDSPYSISKVIGEFYSVYFNRQHQLPVVRARFQNVYGPGEVLGAGIWRGTPATVWRNVTPTFIYRCIKNQSIELHNNGDASRDFIFVEDICKGLIACCLKGKSGEVYNIASGLETSIREWAMLIKELTNSKSEIILAPKRDWDNSGKRYGSTEKSSIQLGFSTDVENRIGLKNTIEWTLNNLELIEQNINKHNSHFI